MEQLKLQDVGRLAAEEFPELAERLAAEAPRPRMQLGQLADLMQRAKGAGDWSRYTAASVFVDRLWARGDRALRGALSAALLEHLSFDGPRGRTAWEALSPQLQRAWEETMRYNESLRQTRKARPPRRQADA